MEILAFDIAPLLGSILKILYVALGLGLVIFFHELGHFAVAKWCGVFVERFSIGFGPILWSFKRGDTEYALSAIPFGGYVKMLGQDDMDPSQLTSDEIAEDPRSYSAKTVPQRMAIISAGVIMNIITGMLFFAGAFRLSVEDFPPQVGHVVVGNPAWVHGFESGDRIVRINDREVETFKDILRGTTLSRGDMTIGRQDRSGDETVVILTPNLTERRRIGIGNAPSLTIREGGNKIKRTAYPGTPAADAEFQDGDVIKSVGGDAVGSGADLFDVLARRRAEDVEVVVDRGGKEVGVEVGRRPFKDLGLWMGIGQISAIRKGSLAEKAELKVGDIITKITTPESDADEAETLVVGTHVNPLFLADVFEQYAGQEITIHVGRHEDGENGVQNEKISVTPSEDAIAWRNTPSMDDTPLEIPSIGAAYHLTPIVSHVVPGSPAFKAEIKPGTELTSIAIASGSDDFKQMLTKSSTTIALDDPKKNSMAFAIWQLQTIADAKVTLTGKGADGTEVKAELEPVVAAADVATHFVPDRGLLLANETVLLHAKSIGGALAMGTRHTRNTTIDIYLTIRNLFSGDLSVKNLSGPIGIAKAAYNVTGQGMSQLLLFLGFLSINLAVLNFLPIPVLDGGHMVFLIWEGVTRRRPSERVQAAATYAGMIFVLGLMVFVIFLDLFVHGAGS